MKREAGFSFRHQASDLNPAGASKSLSMYHHHPAMFVFWFLANNVTQMHMLKNKRRWTCFCQHQIIALHVLNTPPLSEEIPQKSLRSAPKTVTKRAQKHCQWKNKNSRPFLLCIRLHVTQQRAIGSVCHHHGNQFFKKRSRLTGDLATWRMRWRLQSRLIMEPPHSVGGKARLCYINTQAKLPQKIKRHWSRSVLLLLTLLSFPKAALHQNVYYAAVNWQNPPRMDVKIILLFSCHSQVGWHLDDVVSLWMRHRARPVNVSHWGF